MSNYKKKQDAAKAQEKWALENKAQTRRDQSIIGSLYALLQQQKMPIDKVKMQWFHAGAIWADENPPRTTKVKYMAIGAGIASVIGLVLEIIVTVCF